MLIIEAALTALAGRAMRNTYAQMAVTLMGTAISRHRFLPPARRMKS